MGGREGKQVAWSENPEETLTHPGSSHNIVTILLFLKKLNAIHSIRKFIQARE